MKTYEMVALAESDGKTYKAMEMYYNKKNGFTDKDGKNWPLCSYADFNDNKGKFGFHAFIMEDRWEIDEVKRMTKSEIEKILGYKIEIIK